VFLFVAHDFAFGNKKPIFKNPSGIQNYGFWSTGFCCTQFCIRHFWRCVFVVIVGLMVIFQLYTLTHSLKMCKSFYSIAMEGFWSSKHHVPRVQISSEVILWNTLQASLMEPPTFDIHVLNKVYYSTKSSESQPLLMIICSQICFASSIATTLTYTFMFMWTTRRLVKLGHALREMEEKHTCEELCLVEIDCWKMLDWVFSVCPQPWHVLQVFFCSGWDWCEVPRSQYSSHLCCFIQGPVLIRLSSQSTSCVSPCAWNICITCISSCLHFCYSQKSKWVWSAAWIPH
jgi:hypothetical protein